MQSIYVKISQDETFSVKYVVKLATICYNYLDINFQVRNYRYLNKNRKCIHLFKIVMNYTNKQFV